MPFAWRRRSDGLLIGTGSVLGEPSDPLTMDTIELPMDQVSKLNEPGEKRLNGGVITVTPPAPPPPPPPVPDYGEDATPDQTQLIQAVTMLRQYLKLDTASAAQTTSALKLLIRVVLFLTRRVIGG